MAGTIVGSSLSLFGLIAVSSGVRYRSGNGEAIAADHDGITNVLGAAERAETTSQQTAQSILSWLQSFYPIVLLVVFIVLLTARSISAASSGEDDEDAQSPSSSSETAPLGPGGKVLPKRKRKYKREENGEIDFSRGQKLAFEWLALLVAGTFAAHAANVVVHAVLDRRRQWWCGQPAVIYIIGSFMVYCLLVISLLDTSPSPTSAQVSAWMVGLFMELVLLGAALRVYTTAHHEPRVGDPYGGPISKHMNQWEAIDVSIGIVRVMLLACLVILYAVLKSKQKGNNGATSLHGAETRPLLSNGHARINGAEVGDSHEGRTDGYGATDANGANKSKQEGPTAGWGRPKNMPARGWWEYIKGYAIFFPYLWPARDRRLQILTVVCFAIMLAQRGVQFMVPYQAGVVVDDLSGENGDVGIPWRGICLYILYRLLQGNNGILGAARSVIWIPVSQYSERELSVASFEHVHSLSLDFHLGKKTGEVLSALGKGFAINKFLESVTFQVFPMLVDLCVAVAYFMIEFDAYYALTVTVVTFWYIYITIRMAQWRGDIRRQMVDADREVDAVKNDSMVSYETVKYFNAEDREFARYRSAVGKYLKAEYEVYMSLNFMNISQNFVFTAGLMITCFIAAYQVSTGQLKVGKFVALLTYMAQLQSPLNFFGTFYRMIQSSLISAERMLELFKERATVIDRPTAKQLTKCDGAITFDKVYFSYDARRPALQGLDFHCPAGTTTALVGESGGGKSTVFRLLYRFYNSNKGAIRVDGHDIENDVTIDSLRSNIGVVPQDTVLFNETLMYNLKYANPAATDEDVYRACEAASFHNKVLTFPDGYQTKVGERGLRLSGGEKQRVAIARAILKNPRIILLDEATASLDTDTEEHIQEALKTLSEGRTMLIIAHRLSTITMADQIVVVHEGHVVERGTHDELLATKGRYASMWRKQVRAQRAAKEAKILKDKASAGAGGGADDGDEDGKDASKQIGISAAAVDENTGTATSSSVPRATQPQSPRHDVKNEPAAAVSTTTLDPPAVVIGGDEAMSSEAGSEDPERRQRQRSHPNSSSSSSSLSLSAKTRGDTTKAKARGG